MLSLLAEAAPAAVAVAVAAVAVVELPPTAVPAAAETVSLAFTAESSVVLLLPSLTAAAVVATAQAQQNAEYQRKLQEQRLERERKAQMQYFDQRGGGFVNTLSLIHI